MKLREHNAEGFAHPSDHLYECEKYAFVAGYPLRSKLENYFPHVLQYPSRKFAMGSMVFESSTCSFMSRHNRGTDPVQKFESDSHSVLHIKDKTLSTFARSTGTAFEGGTSRRVARIEMLYTTVTRHRQLLRYSDL